MRRSTADEEPPTGRVGDVDAEGTIDAAPTVVSMVRRLPQA